MSDIQDLIHKTSMDCIARGQLIAENRIISLLEEYKCICLEDTEEECKCSAARWALDLIAGGGIRE